MTLLVIVVFVLGYAAIAFEHTLNINKTATALLTGILCWVIFMLSAPTGVVLASETWLHFTELLRLELGTETFATLGEAELFREFVLMQLAEHLTDISQILFFLLGAMTIVELVDSHHAFRFITGRIRTRNPVLLLWVICWVSFFLSAILDNLTTSIVMVSLIRKLVTNRETRLYFAGMIVIAANAGGAWTPIGDVTTTMLWIGGQITTLNIITSLFLPSVVCLLVPLLILSATLKGELGEQEQPEFMQSPQAIRGAKRMLTVGVGILVMVPIFKTWTHLPPYTGILLGLGILWVLSDVIHADLETQLKNNYTVAGALSRIDVPSVLFFLGILLAVSALTSMQILLGFAEFLNSTFGDLRIIVALIGFLSAIVDNVPLVAASMGMYGMETYPTDHFLWEFLAFCAGTGGSMLIIGSAAGVAVMGMEKVDFIWYLKKISVLAMAGYLAGGAVYLAVQ